MTYSCPILLDILIPTKTGDSPRKKDIVMKYEVVALQEKIIAGIATRTSNADPEMKQKNRKSLGALLSGD